MTSSPTPQQGTIMSETTDVHTMSSRRSLFSTSNACAKLSTKRKTHECRVKRIYLTHKNQQTLPFNRFGPKCCLNSGNELYGYIIDKSGDKILKCLGYQAWDLFMSSPSYGFLFTLRVRKLHHSRIRLEFEKACLYAQVQAYKLPNRRSVNTDY